MEGLARRRPAAVVVAAACVGILVVWHCITAGIAIAASRPGGWGDLVVGVAALAIPPALLMLKRWAVILAGIAAGYSIINVVLAFTELGHYRELLGLESRLAAAAVLAVMAILAGVCIVGLMTPSTLRAIRDQ